MGFPIDTKNDDIDLDLAIDLSVDRGLNTDLGNPSGSVLPPSGVESARSEKPAQRELSFGPPAIPSQSSSQPWPHLASSIESIRDRRGAEIGSPLLHTISRWIAVAGGCGYVPLAPGTAGSAAGALLFMALFGVGAGAHWMPGVGTLGGGGVLPGTVGPVVVLVAAVGVLTLLGIWASGWAERDFGQKDDGRIVIDEVVGQLVTLLPLAFLMRPDSSFFSMGTGVVTGFVLFRLFDVWKPGAIRWAERRLSGGLGVMADDLVAGVYAGGALTALILLVSVEGFHLSERLSMSGGLLMSGGLS